MLHYAENDEGVNAGIAAYEAALKANNKNYTIYSYPGTQHAFNNDTGAARYNKAAADLAWSARSRSSRRSSARRRRSWRAIRLQRRRRSGAAFALRALVCTKS